VPLYSSVAAVGLTGAGNKSPPDINPAVAVPPEATAYLPVFKVPPVVQASG
jgi:hypothetical protein